jgi:nucleoside-diphosphate-sugar epimerase
MKPLIDPNERNELHMKVLLFGGTRFMGRYVLKALLAQGAKVTIANRGTRDANPGATNVVCDRSQPGSLEQFANSKFDVVIDFSAYASAWVEEAGNFFANKIEKYIFISTGAVYTSSNIFPITEDFPKGPPHPFADYAREKSRSEALLLEFSNKGFFASTACRLPFVMGPENYEDRESFVFSRLLKGTPLLLGNGGKSIHSFVYAGDVADAIVAIMNAGKTVDKQAFNIATQQATTSRGFVELAAKVCKKEAKLLSYNPDDFALDVANFDLRNVAFPFPENNGYLGSEKIKETIGFEPQHDLLRMLEIYYEWWMAKGDLAPKTNELEQRILDKLIS